MKCRGHCRFLCLNGTFKPIFCGNVFFFQSKRKVSLTLIPTHPVNPGAWLHQNEPRISPTPQKIDTWRDWFFEQRSLVISSRDLFKNPNWEVASNLWKGHLTILPKRSQRIALGAFFLEDWCFHAVRRLHGVRLQNKRWAEGEGGLSSGWANPWMG